ncbi:tetratricopeptide repeat protein [Candidatus Amarolinea dominans]|uniref:tetratricopeptide repeat protein n=1 Tax=Candidatus Amarolinea dominans TaxID=3140696 RepID=UPI0031358152|nr:tetratricopeptide repeat protein [Anaerolineae bacterium]
MGMLRWQMTTPPGAAALRPADRLARGHALAGMAGAEPGPDRLARADLQRAAAALQTAVRRLPVSGAAWRGLGRVQLAQAQPADAQTSLQQALDHLPGDSLTHLELARTLARLGQDEQALAHFRAAGWRPAESAPPGRGRVEPGRGRRRR